MTEEKPLNNAERLIPLAERKFATRQPAKQVLVIQYVTEKGTGKQYFRFMPPSGDPAGFASTAEEAVVRVEEIAKRLNLEIHDQIIHVET